MEKQKLIASRERLDMALSSPDLSKADSVELLVKTQILRSPFAGTEDELVNVVRNRSEEVFNFIDMLRSASSIDAASTKASRTSGGDWKMKQDSDQVRIMYREGPQGSPFHTMLVEGFADGPIDVCLCVSWESTLYKKWWPHFSVPPFQITMSTCLKRVGVGEEISLLRMKVPWPMADREALLHYFELECPEDDLIFALIKTIPGDGFPEAENSVRVDVLGGFVLQKISPTRCYFRAIMNLDIKLDIVPPSLINFVARQLIGSGYKLYQKVITSVAASDEDYCEALKHPMYARARGEEDPASAAPEEKLSSAECRAFAGDVEEEAAPGGKSPLRAAGPRSGGRISPEVESAVSMMDQIIGVVRDLKSHQHGGGSSPAAAELQSLACTEAELRKVTDEKDAPPLAVECRHAGDVDGEGPKTRSTSAPPAGEGLRVAVKASAAGMGKGKRRRFSFISCFSR